METEALLKIFRHMAAARAVDQLEASLAQRGEVFFYIPSAGHEATAAIAPHLGPQDWLKCHYRDRALAMARGVPMEEFFYALFGKEESNSGGRRMPGFPSDPSLNILSSPTPTGNAALHAVGVAQTVKDQKEAPIVICSTGDGTTQQGEFMEAVAEAVRSRLPVLFLIEDNHYALSTPTRGRTLYSLPGGEADQFMGLEVIRIDGADAEAVYRQTGELIHAMREDRAPRFVVMKTERLASHTNADDESVYRDEAELKRIRETGDPVRNLAEKLVELGVEQSALHKMEEEVSREVQQAMVQARHGQDPQLPMLLKKPLPDSFPSEEPETGGPDSLTMLEAMREVLRKRLASDKRVCLYGEDIQDPKGDVFGLTRGLSTDFPEQVENSPLAESTIVGASIGRALAGDRPVACIQFADFLPVAYNQLMCELGSMYWRTKGQWNAPVIVLAICGAYRPGLGPFHAQAPDATMAQIPGVDVYTPSTAADAAGMLNAAFESDRPSVFLYPKSLINDRARMTSEAGTDAVIPIGKARIARPGDHLTMVGWGSTMPLCEKIAEYLEAVDMKAEVIDLRCISPWDRETVIKSAKRTQRLLVVHEDNLTCGLGGEILATVSEEDIPGLKTAREGRKDTFVPYHFESQLKVIPSLRSVMKKAADLLDLDLEWEEPVKAAAGSLIINAIGSSPSDETIQIVTLHAGEGDRVEEGQILASVEADKASMEISAPAAGTLKKILTGEGDSVTVGEPIFELQLEDDQSFKRVTQEDTGRPILTRKRSAAPRAATVTSAAAIQRKPVILNTICSKVGSRTMKNEDFLEHFPDWTSEDVLKRTGIAERPWIKEGETALSLAVDACQDLLEREQLDVSDLSAIICSTGTPPSSMTPSLACRILLELTPEGRDVMVQAHDINAACSGYLYGLQQAYDALLADPTQKILLVTAETLSPVVDRTDPHTAFIFADAATASLITCDADRGDLKTRISRPVLSAKGVEEHILRVPFLGSGEHVNMEGQQVFRVAVRKMVDMLDAACAAEQLTVDKLDMIVTHQANERIIEAARKMINFPKERVFNQMRKYGNTSSNTIPIALQTVLANCKPSDRVGLTAFGGGYTFGAALLEVLG